MKVQRVIISLNNNPKYTIFWDTITYVWLTKFKIKPTLIFNGTEKEFNDCGFNLSNCDFIRVDRIQGVSEPNPDWSVTWSLFWGSSQFPDDVCMLHGADQIPISNLFYETLENFSDDKFVIGFADAYEKYTLNTLGYFNTATNVLYPSSHLVGKGSFFKKIFEIDDDWTSEVTKVHNSRNRYYLKNKFYPKSLWGLDECYASEKISTYEDRSSLIFMDFFWKNFQDKRIELPGTGATIDMDLVKEGQYSEFTCKSFEFYKSIIQQVVSHIREHE